MNTTKVNSYSQAISYPESIGVSVSGLSPEETGKQEKKNFLLAGP